MAISIEIDISGAKGILEGPERLRLGISEGIRQATEAVWEDARDPSHYGVGQGGGGRFGLRQPRNETDTLRIITGALVNSITQEVRELSPTEIQGEIGSSLPYARIHEMGGGFIPARPYLGPALDRQHDKVIALMQKAIDKSLGSTS